MCNGLFFFVFRLAYLLLQTQNIGSDYKSIFEIAGKSLIYCKTEYDLITIECQRYQLQVFGSSIM